MANCCAYELRVDGSKESVDKFLTLGTEGGVFRTYYFEKDSETTKEDGNVVVKIYGDCAWSVRSSFINDRKEGMSLPELSKSLKVDFEYWSEEYGFEFEEHGLIRDGEFVIEDCFHVEWHCFYENEGMTFEEWLEDEELDGYTKEDLDDNNEIVVGYQEWKFEIGEK